jgi:hypothetical protein
MLSTLNMLSLYTQQEANSEADDDDDDTLSMVPLLHYPCLARCLQTCVGAMAGYASLLQPALEDDEESVLSTLQSDSLLFSQLQNAEQFSLVETEVNVLLSLQLSLELLLENEIQPISDDMADLLRVSSQCRSYSQTELKVSRDDVVLLDKQLQEADNLYDQLRIVYNQLELVEGPLSVLKLCATRHIMPYELKCGDCSSDVFLSFDTLANQQVYIEGDLADIGVRTSSSLSDVLQNDDQNINHRLYVAMLQSKLNSLPMQDMMMSDCIQEVSCYLGRLRLVMSDFCKLEKKFKVDLHITKTQIHVTVIITSSVSFSALYQLPSPMCRYWCLPCSITLCRNGVKTKLTVPSTCCSIEACATLLQTISKKALCAVQSR